MTIRHLRGLCGELPPRLMFAAGVLALASVGSGPARAQGAEFEDARARVAVRVAHAELARLRDVEVGHLVDYGSFVQVELAAGDLPAVRDQAIDIGPPRSLALELQGYRVDTAGPRERRLATPGIWGRGFHLVQLLGPAKDEWMAALAAGGVEVLQYLDPYVHLVRADEEQLAALEALDFIRWVGPYLPEYRTPEHLLAREGLIANVSVAVYDGGAGRNTVEPMIADIEQLGGVLVEREGVRGGDAFVTAVFRLPAASVRSVAALSDVGWLTYRAPVDDLEDEMSDQIIAGNFNPLAPGYQAWQGAAGVTGNGVTLAVVDTGYDTGVDGTAHPDLSGRTIMIPDDGNNIPTDGNGHGTHVGGTVASNGSLGSLDASGFLMGLGVAPNATLAVRLLSDADSSRTRDVVNNGAVASNNSYALHDAGLGYEDRDRTYDILVRDADQSTPAVAEPLVIVFSAGNSGMSGCTKEAKNIIAVANSLNNRDSSGNPGVGDITALRGSSSRGPAGDGRVYPHLTAPGTNIISTRSTQGPVDCGSIPVDAPGANPTYSLCTGTSMAAPHMTGAVGLVTEWWRTFNGGANPSPAMAKALLVNGAVDMGAADIPNGNEGWGRIDLGNVINTGTPAQYADQATLLADTGQSFSKTLSAADPSQPLRITLAWSDAPGPGGGGNPMALVNDLDLVVVDSSMTFLGNDFASGFSTTGGAADAVDNLENVFIQNPDPLNFFTVTVLAAGINGDGVPYNGDTTDQDFALVCTNALFNVSAPTALCTDVTVHAGATCTADADIDDGSFDGDGDPITLDQDPPGPYALGDTLVTLTATDDKGAKDTCQATVTVIDVTPPVVTCPADTVITCGESIAPSNTGMATATDNCDPMLDFDFDDEVTPTDCPADPIQEVIARTWTATDDAGNSDECVQTITVLKQVKGVDIKPGSCPNAYKPDAGGVLPLSLIGTDMFDVASVDTSTLLLSRADCVGGAVAPVRLRFEDAATPFSGSPCDCHEARGDGITDLSLKFGRSELLSALQLRGFVHGDTVEIVLSGTLDDGCEFTATDCVLIR